MHPNVEVVLGNHRDWDVVVVQVLLRRWDWIKVDLGAFGNLPERGVLELADDTENLLLVLRDLRVELDG